MTHLQIHNHFTGEIIFEGGIETAVELKISLNGANLERANLERANLNRANLNWANLNWANLEGANLERANLNWANLKETNLEGANLKWANLNGANLEGANLNGANLNGANLEETNLEETNLWVSRFQSFTVAATTKHLQIGCEIHDWEIWLDERKRREIAKENNDRGDFEGFFKVCLAAKTWLDSQFLEKE